MKNFIAEFKTFALRGNVMDLAIGVIIGAAFSKIIDSLVGDIIMPIIGVFLGGIDFTKLSFGTENVQIMYGHFVQAVFNLLIVAFVLFVFIKTINRIKKNKPKQIDPESSPDDIALLTEIRDILKSK